MYILWVPDLIICFLCRYYLKGIKEYQNSTGKAVTRYFIEMAFNGEGFHGWQRQQNAITVQQTLEEALQMLLQFPVIITGAGRTDTGVHASYFVAHFDADVINWELSHLVKRLNSFLPAGIVIYSIQAVSKEAHSRFNAIARTYEYHLVLEKNPFLNRFTDHPRYSPDFAEMNRAATGMMKFSDFTSFSRLHGNAKTNICNITQAYWEKRDECYVFVVTANRFLRNMVRAMVGTLLEVGKGSITVEDFFEIIEAHDRGRAGTSAPAQALFLTDIEYPEGVFERKRLMEKGLGIKDYWHPVK